MAGIFGLFGGSKKEKNYEIVEVYRGLRGKIFALDPNTVNIQQNHIYPIVWGSLMETGHSEAVSTLVALADGTVSLYFSNGGGMIGLGQHEPVQIVAEQFIKQSQDYTKELTATEQYPLPKKGYTRFYLLTFDGVLTTEVAEDVLGNGQHKLSPLFMKGQELITQARLIDEVTRRNEKKP